MSGYRFTVTVNYVDGCRSHYEYDHMYSAFDCLSRLEYSNEFIHDLKKVEIYDRKNRESLFSEEFEEVA